jgi:SAM-dependent methyltransferase
MYLTVNDIVKKNRVSGRGFTPDGVPRPFTNEEFFEISREMGSTQENPAYRALFEALAQWIRGTLGVARVLEIGSGPGYLLNCLNDLGVDAQGVDGNPYSRAFFVCQHPRHARRYALDPTFSNTYQPVDALVSIEVFEHIPDDGLHNILKKVRDEMHPKYFVFSSTPYADPNEHWDLHWGHINIKQPAEWDRLFAEYGYNRTALRPPVTEWAALYALSN